MTKLVALGVGLVLAGLIAVPTAIMMMAAGTPPPSSCGGGGPAVLTADGSPTIQGPSSLTVAQITAWWLKAHGPSMAIHADPATFIGYYINHGTAEGIRGDWAFAQAVAETGAFTNPDSINYNNFAGIGHPDGAAHGIPFASPEVGAIAHLQMLKEVATGSNAGPFAEPKVTVNWGGRPSTTWYQLGNQGNGDRGYWASAKAADYWKLISGVYTAMGGVLGVATLVAANPPGTPTPTSTTSTTTPQGAPGTTTTVPVAGGCDGGAGGAGPNCGPAAGGTTTTAPPAAVPVAAATPDPLAKMWSFLCAQLGKPYQWGGSGPDSWDCSGLTQGAYAQLGVTLPHNAAMQYHLVNPTRAPMGLDQLRPGDLVFFEGPEPGHVGIIVQAGGPGKLPKMEDAPHTGAVVEIVDIWASSYVGAGRPVLPGVHL